MVGRVPAYLVIDPLNPGSILTLGKDEFEGLSQKAKIAGGKLRFTKTTRKVYRQAYLGNVLPEVGDAPCKNHFSFKCMAGKRNRNKNTFFGIVRAMKDPARWSNKWMSQTMHIMNTTAKGGIAVERGTFFDNDAQGEASWAHQDQVTYLKPGGLSGTNPKFIPKPVSQYPLGSFELMQYAVQSHRDASGVNVEILGMQSSAGQAASLDLQRMQSALTILQRSLTASAAIRPEPVRDAPKYHYGMRHARNVIIAGVLGAMVSGGAVGVLDRFQGECRSSGDACYALAELSVWQAGQSA